MTNDQKRDALEAIRLSKDGVLRPEDVVREARREDHPLHGEFEWDDSKAAESYRIDQARTLIRSVRVTVTVERRRFDTVYYVSDALKDAQESGYVAIPRVRDERQLAIETIAAEFERVEAMLKRTRDVAFSVGLSREGQLAADLLALLADRFCEKKQAS